MAENLLSTVANARSFTRIFDALARVQTPALIWHARGGERIELSGRVFMNWVAKSANLMVNECEVTEESGVQITAPLHWRFLVLACATLYAGSCFDDEEPLVGASDTTDHAQNLNNPDYLLLVDRGPLSMRYLGDLHEAESATDAEVIDFCALVRSEADQFIGLPASTSSPVGNNLTSAELTARVLSRAHEHAGHDYRLPSGERALALRLHIPSEFDSAPSALTIVTEALACLIAGYAVFLPDPLADFTATELDPLLRSERALDLTLSHY